MTGGRTDTIRQVTGVVHFFEGNDDAPPDILQISRECEEEQLKRLAAVKAQIASVGLTTHDAVKTREDKDWDGSVRMVVGRYVVTPPSCPNWTKPSGSDWTNATPSNHGCATTINLGLMLADPGDLVRARPITPSDGQAGASKVDKYRKGQTEKAKLTSTAGGSSQ